MDFQTFCKLYDQESGGDQQPAAAEPEQAEQPVMAKTKRPSADFNEFRRLFVRSPDSWQAEAFSQMAPAWADVAGVHCDGIPVFKQWVERSRGCSKTFDTALFVTWILLASEERITGISVAATFDQSHRLIDSIRTIVDQQPRFADVLDVQNNCVKNKQTGSKVLAVAGNTHAVTGMLINFLICDELSEWTDRKLWDSVISTAGKKPGCLLVILTNAGHRDSWQYEIREDIRRAPEWLFLRSDSLGSWITGVEQQRKLLLESEYRRLWENTWVRSDESGLSATDIDAAINQTGPVTCSEAGFVYVAGLDLAIKHDNASFCITGRHLGSHEVIEFKPKWHHNRTIQAMQDTGHFPLEQEVQEIRTDATYRLRLAECRVWKPIDGKIDIDKVERYILEAQKRFNLQAVLFDPHQALSTAQRLEKVGVNMIEVTQGPIGLQSMATHLISAFSENNIDMHPDELLVSELRQLRIVQKRNGSFRIESPRTTAGHGDCVTAFQLAIKGCRENTKAPAPRTRLPLMESNSIFQPEFADTGTGWYQSYGMF